MPDLLYLINKGNESIGYLNMDEVLESYHIGKIAVTVTQSERSGRYHIDCREGEKHLGFEVKQSEYENYHRLMNQRIKEAFEK